MKSLLTVMTCGVAAIAILLPAQDSKPVTVVKALKNRAERGTLADRREQVRGDTGKWNDTPALLHAPPLELKPQGMPMDDWADELAKLKATTTAAGDNWLIFRTRQLDDNDRVWVERIERRGNEFTVMMSEAVWQGHYFKTFTFYEVIGVNLGPLPPGDYTVKWVVQPLVFTRFEDPGKPLNNWPKDERASDGKPLELRVAFPVR